MISADDRVWRPTSIDEALEILAARPDVSVVAGGTDSMVGVNAGRTSVRGWLALGRIDELRGISSDGGWITIGAATSMAMISDRLGDLAPALAAAAKTVGGPQIRSQATIGGNIATGSPAGDTLTPLLALGAEVELRSVEGVRRVALSDLLTGPKQTDIGRHELIVAVRVQDAGPRQVFCKLGPRGAMVIAVVNMAAFIDRPGTGAGVAVGSCGPTAMSIPAASELLLDPSQRDSFRRVVVEAIRPIDDVRGSAAQRRHATGVLAGRIHDWLHRG